MDDPYWKPATGRRPPLDDDKNRPGEAGFFVSADEPADLMKRRAEWLSRRFALAPTLAKAVAESAFCQVEVTR